MNIKTVVVFAVVAFALFMVVTSPTSAAGFVHSAFNGLTALFRSLGTFVSHL